MRKFYLNLKSKIKNNFNYKNYKFGSKTMSTASYYQTFMIFPLFVIPKLALMEEEEEKEKESTELTMKEIIKGEYENKIRTFASIEKKFSIFANCKKIGDLKMSYYQFIDSLTPFQYIKTKSSEEMEKFLSENKNFQQIIKVIDVNGDNSISFEEYIVFSLFLSLRQRSILAKHSSGKITRTELTDDLMDYLKTQDSLKITNESFFDGRLVKTDENKVYQTIMEFFARSFPDKVELSVEKDLKTLKEKIYYVMSLYEFYRIPQIKENTISMENFARVIASYVNIYKCKALLNKIDRKELVLEGEVTFDQFLSFFWFLNNIYNDKFQLFKNNKLSAAELLEYTKTQLKKMPDFGMKINKNISEAQINTFIKIFDENGKMFIYFQVMNILKFRKSMI
jgi:hypothetical protein